MANVNSIKKTVVSLSSKTIILGVVVLSIGCFAACNSLYKVIPYYTEPSKIAQLSVNMELSKVNQVLGIEPYDVYHMQDDGSSILVYAYRRKERKIKKADKPENIYGPESQTNGEVWYTSEGFAYLLFNKGKLQSLITDEGRKSSKAILVSNNIIQLISKKQLVNYQEAAELWKVDGIKYHEDEDEKNATQLVIPLENGKLKGVQSINLNVD